MKKLMTLLISCLLVTTVFGQTATIGTGCCGIGQMIAIPVYATGWEDVEAITMSIQFDQSQLDFLYCDFHPDFKSNMIYNNDNGVVRFAWYTLTPETLDNGKFCTMFFIQWGASPLTFVPINEFVKTPYIIMNMTYVNGGVTLPPSMMRREQAW